MINHVFLSSQIRKIICSNSSVGSSNISRRIFASIMLLITIVTLGSVQDSATAKSTATTENNGLYLKKATPQKKKQKIDYAFKGKILHTKYPCTKSDYALKQYRASKSASVARFKKYLSINEDTTHGFKFLRLDMFRKVNKDAFTAYFQNKIEGNCMAAKIKPANCVLYGKAEECLNAAKKYNIDPIFFVTQTFLESAYGTSKLAAGNRITKVAYKSFKRNKKGKFLTHKIKKSRKVYNLYGIKAYDSDPIVGATSYAYHHGWTTVKKAIYGAAKYLKENYIGTAYKQNTIFKMRYTFQSAIWHQYATSPSYAEDIGKRMYLMKSLYSKKAKFIYDLPKYK